MRWVLKSVWSWQHWKRWRGCGSFQRCCGTGKRWEVNGWSADLVFSCGGIISGKGKAESREITESLICGWRKQGGSEQCLLFFYCVWVKGVVVVVMAGDSSSSTSASRELDQTPTWAVAGICAVMIIISIVLEKVLHRVGKVSSWPSTEKPFNWTRFFFSWVYAPLLFRWSNVDLILVWLVWMPRKGETHLWTGPNSTFWPCKILFSFSLIFLWFLGIQMDLLAPLDRVFAEMVGTFFLDVGLSSWVNY